MIGLAYALSGSRTVAEDLAQDAFLAAHKNWDKVGRYDKPGAWVRRVVANMSVSQFRRKVREAKALARMRSDEASFPRCRLRTRSSGRQSGRYRSARHKRSPCTTLEDRSVVDIAEILECAEGTVKVHLFKGRRSLARRLGLEIGEAS